MGTVLWFLLKDHRDGSLAPSQFRVIQSRAVGVPGDKKEPRNHPGNHLGRISPVRKLPGTDLNGSKRTTRTVPGGVSIRLHMVGREAVDRERPDLVAIVQQPGDQIFHGVDRVLLGVVAQDDRRVIILNLVCDP